MQRHRNLLALLRLLLFPVLVGVSIGADPIPIPVLVPVDFGDRTWTNAEGREIEARLTSADESRAHLLLAATGKTVPVPIATLSAGDQEYIRSWIEAKKDAWGIEIDRKEEKMSYRVRTDSDDKDYARQTIRPAEGKSLLLLEFRIRPAPERTVAMFDDLSIKLRVQPADGSKVVEATAIYLKKRESDELDAEGFAEGTLLFEIPRGAKPIEIQYLKNPPIPVGR